MIDGRVNIDKLTLNGTSKKGVLEKAVDQLAHRSADSLLTIATVNPEQVVQAHSDDHFRSALNKFSIIIADGVGITVATRLLYGKSIDRITGVDLAEKLVSICLEHKQRILLVGGTPGVAEKAAAALCRKYHADETLFIGLDGYQNVQVPTTDEEAHVVKVIQEIKPALILVAFGAPHQEKWLMGKVDIFKQSQVSVAMVVGGAVDYWAGEVLRAPQFVRNLGFEWLFRLIQQPWRIRRQLRLVHFVWLLIWQKLSANLQSLNIKH